jgi:glycosyltransferase involved in cell wall biosynthesis
MKLLMTTDTVGGIWTYSLELARALQRYGVQMSLATMGPRMTQSQRADAAGHGNVRLHESEFRLEWMAQPWEDVDRAAEWLIYLEETERPDIVHLNGYAHGDLPWAAPVVVVAHSCVRSWWEAVHGVAAPSEWELYTERVRAGLRAADLVVAPTRAMRAAVDRLYGPLPRSRVIFNGRDPSSYAPAPKEPFVLAAGRLWDEAKNLATLDRAAAHLPWPVYVAGDCGPPRGDCESSDAVHLLGVLDSGQLADWMARASIFALPAYYEPFGLAVLEAALAGCALVLGDIPSLREVWKDAALFVPPGDHVTLTAALRRLLGDPLLRRAYASAAHRRARHLGPARMGREYHAAYTTLLYDARRQSREVPCAS